MPHNAYLLYPCQRVGDEAFLELPSPYSQSPQRSITVGYPDAGMGVLRVWEGPELSEYGAGPQLTVYLRGVEGQS